jgi:hypothetical protein
MKRAARSASAGPAADPFAERRRPALTWSTACLGTALHFESDDPQLMGLARVAFADLPRHRFGGAPPLRIRLVTVPAAGRAQRNQPAVTVPLGGHSLLAGATAGSSFVTVDAGRREALVAVARPLLRHPYHVRYELIEFAGYLLATRAQNLVPLHGACLGYGGRGILLLGDSGAGKSTLMLQALQRGLDFLAEDSVLVRPRDLAATGLANFLHLRTDSLRFLEDGRLATQIRRAPTITRRSGVRKLEIDLRGLGVRLAGRPLQLCATVFVSPRRAPDNGLLVPLAADALRRRLHAEQAYASGQEGWPRFLQQVQKQPAFELLRAAHPGTALDALAALLGAPRIRPAP